MPDDTLTPELIAGRYRVLREVGRGGMGRVWLCQDERLGREVAVKGVGRLPGQSVTDQARALREIRSSAALNHPNVVSVYDAVAEDDRVWLVMEYVPGHTLKELTTAEGPLDPARAARIGAQVADGLAAAHERGTVHRDVKPGNVLVADGDVAKIADFGIARTRGDETLTEHGMLTGTPTYMAPELARGQDPTPASDVWALGATLYAAVEGRPPYEDQTNALALLATIAESRPPEPERAGPLAGPIGRMLDPDPVSRWSMADAAHALHRVAEESGTRTAPQVPPSEPATPEHVPAVAPVRDPAPRRRRGGLAALLALLLVAAVVGGVALLMSGGDDEEPAADSSSATRTSRSPDPTSTATITETATATATEEASTSEAAPAGTGSPAAFVEDYYAVLPEDIDGGWAMLSEDYQDETGYEDYEAFWSGIDDVTVEDTRPAGSGAIDADLVYTQDGETQSETRRLYLERGDDGYLISGSELV